MRYYHLNQTIKSHSSPSPQSISPSSSFLLIPQAFSSRPFILKTSQPNLTLSTAKHTALPSPSLVFFTRALIFPQIPWYSQCPNLTDFQKLKKKNLIKLPSYSKFFMVFFFPKETNSLFFDLAFKDLTFSVFTDIF